MKKALLIKVDGNIEIIKPKNNKNFSYKEMKKIVGGMVEIVSLNKIMF